MLNQFKQLLFKTGFSGIFDKARFYYFKITNIKKNSRFRRFHPGYQIPPDKFLYETFRLDYEVYFKNIDLISREIVSITKPHLDYNKSDLSILDWGCGVGGNIKGLKEIVSSYVKLFACDINSQMIEWNSKYLPGIGFNCINPLPPTGFSEESFDLILGISIFTHLSRESHFLWINELHRILKRNGLLFITTHGSSYKSKLTNKEKEKFNNGDLVVRDYSKEGIRVFTSFHPPSFIQKLIKTKFEIISFYDGSEFPELIGNQDKWVLKKL